MKSGEVIKTLCKSLKIPQTNLADALGVKHQSAVSMKLARNGFTMKAASQMLGILGYEVAFVPKDTPLPEGCFRITE